MEDESYRNEIDDFIYKNEILDFLPCKIFDSHSHLSDEKFHPNFFSLVSVSKYSLLKNTNYSKLKKWWLMLFPEVEVSGLVMGMPTAGCDTVGINNWVASEVSSDSRSRFSILVTPEMTTGCLEEQVVRLKPAGLKPYMCFADLVNQDNASICEMIPEYQIAIADRYGLAITLHLAKPTGMADAKNLEDIQRLVKKYPNCNFILAHCGRCFITPYMRQAIGRLPKADNLWIDTSAVCDIGVFEELFNGFDRKKILFGTDLVLASGFRGSYVRVGAGWDSIIIDPYDNSSKATFLAYENLCAFCHAARFCGLNSEELEDIFYNNAAGLFNLNS
ncbi:MAG: amidohydrolase family protein [Sedimentisphaeraceae bacterium JB056]